MKVGQILDHPLVTINREQTVGDALSLMNSDHVSHLIVTDENKLVGVISKTDLISQMVKMLKETTGQTMSTIQLRTQKIESFMSTELITVKEDDDLAYAVELLLQKQFHCLPVINDANEPIGILTSFDLLKAYYESP